MARYTIITALQHFGFITIGMNRENTSNKWTPKNEEKQLAPGLVTAPRQLPAQPVVQRIRSPVDHAVSTGRKPGDADLHLKSPMRHVMIMGKENPML